MLRILAGPFTIDDFHLLPERQLRILVPEVAKAIAGVSFEFRELRDGGLRFIDKAVEYHFRKCSQWVGSKIPFRIRSRPLDSRVGTFLWIL